MHKSILQWLWLIFFGILTTNFNYAQGEVYTKLPTLKNILKNICNFTVEETNSSKSTCNHDLYLIHYQENKPKLINLVDSIQELMDNASYLDIKSSYLDHPLYALYAIEILEQELPKHLFKSNSFKYKQAILEVYETSNKALNILPLEERVLYGDDPNLAILAHSYDLTFVLVDSSFQAKKNVLFSTNLSSKTSEKQYIIDIQNPNYLERITAQGNSLQAGFREQTKRKKSTNPLLYWAIGGIFLGIISSILFHQFYWKKEK